MSDQLAEPSGTKPLVAVSVINVPKYFENDLQRILKAVLEGKTPALAFAPALAPIVSEMPWEKLKVYFLNIYRGKCHINYYNFCQQCKDYFAIAGATGPT